MRVYDRGSIKWTSMMLPEHVDLLQDMWKRLEDKEMPVLDEQKLAELDLRLQTAIHQNLTVEIKYYNGRDYLTSKGNLKYVNRDHLCLQSDKVIKREQVLDIWIN